MFVFLLAALTEAATHKDVVISEVGAGAAFVGFALVFLGVLITTYQALLPTLSDSAVAKIKKPAWISLFVIMLGLASVVVSTSWLVSGGGDYFYVATLVVFFAELVALVGVAVFSTRVLLK